MQYVTPFVKSDFICKHTLLQLMWSLGLISFNRVAIFFLFLWIWQKSFSMYTRKPITENLHFCMFSL